MQSFVFPLMLPARSTVNRAGGAAALHFESFRRPAESGQAILSEPHAAPLLSGWKTGSVGVSPGVNFFSQTLQRLGGECVPAENCLPDS